MKPVLAVEFSARNGDTVIQEESVPLHSAEELFRFVAPGGGCDAIPGDVSEIRMVFAPPEHPNSGNPAADLPATLQLGMVMFNGPLSEVTATASRLLDKAGRGELTGSFRAAIGLAQSSDQPGGR